MTHVPSILCVSFALSVLWFWLLWPGKRSSSEVIHLVFLWLSGLAAGLSVAFWP